MQQITKLEDKSEKRDVDLRPDPLLRELILMDLDTRLTQDEREKEERGGRDDGQPETQKVTRTAVPPRVNYNRD